MVRGVKEIKWWIDVSCLRSCTVEANSGKGLPLSLDKSGQIRKIERTKWMSWQW